MFLHVLVVFFTFTAICIAAPTLEKEHCGKPDHIEGAILQGVWNAATYSPGSVARFTCVNGYIQDGPIRMACIEGAWLDISRGQCKRIEQTCSAPPVVQHGDTIDVQRLSYPPGSSVRYKCANYYKMEGKDTITCIDGGWEKEPICRGIEQTCSAPPVVQHGDTIDVQRLSYPSGSSVRYKCANLYKMEGKDTITCIDGEWEREPICRAIAQSCGAPPVVQFGDITDIKRLSYPSGSSVKYKCANYYKLEGKDTITCRDGEWEKEPICRVPCTVREIDMQENNIQLKYRTDKKLYSEHGDSMSFECIPGYTISDETSLRIQCLDGVLKYPKCQKEVPCTVREIDMQENNIQLKYRTDKTLYSKHGDYMSFECIPGYTISDERSLRIQCLAGVLKYPKCLKEGFCVLQQTEMNFNNIYYNKSNVVENWQIITFECVEGTVPENYLKSRCINKQIKYPKCSAGEICLPPTISNALISPKKEDGYKSGSSIEIKCEDSYVLNGHMTVKCRNGQWDELPQCLKPCTISAESLNKNHIEIRSSGNPPETLEHGTQLSVKCKAKFRRPGVLTALCYDGTMTYPRCFSGGFCRINQQDLDDNNLELDERHGNEVFYEEGETVHFTCKAGYRNRSGLIGRCTKPERAAGYELTYPVCEWWP